MLLRWIHDSGPASHGEGNTSPGEGSEVQRQGMSERRAGGGARCCRGRLRAVTAPCGRFKYRPPISSLAISQSMHQCQP